MKIKNLKDLKKNIHKLTLIGFLIVFIMLYIALIIIHKQFLQKESILISNKIIGSEEIYQSNLAANLQIVANSTIFVDFIRSGSLTRDRLYTQFLSMLALINNEAISGMKIADNDDEVIFTKGQKTENYVKIKLCYTNQILNSDMGECRYTWSLYFNKKSLLRNFLEQNHEIKTGSKSDLYEFFHNVQFGNFKIIDKSPLLFNLTIKNESDSFFYICSFLITLTLLVFGCWNWYRLNYILNKYIANPIHTLTKCLKSNVSVETENNIQEIQFLVAEIQLWKSKLDKIQNDKNAAKLSTIAAQLAHDVRSPLSAIDMIVKKIINIPEQHRVILQRACQRISDIANNFLTQYRSPEIINKEKMTNEHIASILESIISEKRSQFADKEWINIFFVITAEAYDLFALINAVNFRTVLSNLINNAVESIDKKGTVTISLIRKETKVRIEIVDDGCGIPYQAIPKIISGGISIGKKNGNGLGLSHAIKMIEGWHGDIDIQSRVNEGTKIGINLPHSSIIPAWFTLSVPIKQSTTFCILDNEQYIHAMWRKKLTSFLPNAYKNIHHMSSCDEFDQFIINNNKNNIIYFIDHDLGDRHSNGLNLIQKYNLNENVFLVTNNYDEESIQNNCIEIGIKMIPKNYVEHIPMIITD